MPKRGLPFLAPINLYFALCLDSGAVFAQKESPGAPPAFASPPDPWGRLHRSPLAFPAWVRPPEAARTPGSDKERPVERRESSLTKEEKDRYASPKLPSQLLTVHLPLSLYLTSGVSLFSPPILAPPGTSPSHGPSPEYLLLLLRPGLVRKGPGQPRNLCG